MPVTIRKAVAQVRAVIVVPSRLVEGQGRLCLVQVLLFIQNDDLGQVLSYFRSSVSSPVNSEAWVESSFH